MSWLTRSCQLLCVQLLLLYSQSYANLCSSDQSAALRQFKQLFSFDERASSTCETSSPKMVSWKEDNDCCSWDGVTCDMVTGHVIDLDLSCSWLYGEISPDSTLFLLPHLQRLNLAFNNFGFCHISSGFGRLTSLTLLNLSSSNFYGYLPHEISCLSKLVSLDLSENHDVILKTAVLEMLVQNLTKLEELILKRVDMSRVMPGSLANLSSSLISLSLTGCELQGNFPDNIFRLPNLQKISLAKNYLLTGGFQNINRSNALSFLDVSLTHFSGGLPDSIGNLRSLRRLNLKYCFFTGSVPESFGNLTQLTSLDLSFNNFSGCIPFSLSNLEQLRHLDLSFNNFVGEFPDIFVNLTRVSYLVCSRNRLTGPIPYHVAGLRNLFRIDLHSNLLNGTIPSKLLTLPLLEHADLSHNQLTGHIDEFQNNSLEILNLSKNRLNGSIPSSIFELANLNTLRLSSNHFSGIVELYMFSKLIHLEELVLSNNSISVSTAIKVNSSFPKVSTLELSSCNINEFPEILRTLDKLEWLDLSDNKIYGQTPTWMYGIGQETLEYLDLHNNFITRIEQIPWKNLAWLDLRSNLLQGSLPILPPSLTYFFISNNKLEGEIHHSICNMDSIEILDLSNNSLSGNVPECMANFSSNLQVLEMQKNRFHGTIPSSFAETLKTINFNGNELEGPIPRSLVNCTMLEVLDFGDNKINDTFPRWLEKLPHLQVLVLHFNKFYGVVRGVEAKHSFPRLRIIDLSNNDFSGPLPTEYFRKLNAMMKIDEGGGKLKYMGDANYETSIHLTIKGSYVVVKKILRTFNTIDLSSNNFHGEIPEVIGKLHALRLINLSHNSLTGHIPSSLGSLTELESLDLCSNKLVGEIPQQLADLKFLEFLNLSQNLLIGKIPSGPQLNTFGPDSYCGNLGLCGFPLSNNCSINEPPQPSSKSGDTESENGFGWRSVAMGYGFGMVLGITMGYIAFSTSKPRWLLRVLGLEQQNVRRLNNKCKGRRI